MAGRGPGREVAGRRSTAELPGEDIPEGRELAGEVAWSLQYWRDELAADGTGRSWRRTRIATTRPTRMIAGWLEATRPFEGHDWLPSAAMFSACGNWFAPSCPL